MPTVKWNYFLLPTIIANFATVQGGVTCGQGYSLLESTGFCYRLFSWPPCNFWEASEYCQNVGAKLASIHSKAENTLVESLSSGRILIGLQYSKNTNAFEWSDGTPVDYTNYADGFEEEKERSGYCVMQENGQWENADCDGDMLDFVCKKQAVQYSATASNVCPNANTEYAPGVVVSPGYPSNATDGSSCIYRISAKEDHFLNIYLDELYLQPDSWHGYIFIYQYQCTSSDLMMEILTLVDPGHQFLLPVNQAVVEFHLRVGGKWKISSETASLHATISRSKALHESSSNMNGNLYCMRDYALYGELCYRFVSDVMLDYYDAVAYCREHGGDLASVRDADGDAFLRELVGNGEATIGLNYGSNALQWSDGSAVNYTNFADDFSAQCDSRGYCAKIQGTAWQNVECTDRLNFICEGQSYSPSPSDLCAQDGPAYNDMGVVTSSGYPQAAALNDKCAFQLIVKKGKFIRLFLDDVQVSYAGMWYYINGEYVGMAGFGRTGTGGEMIIPCNRVKICVYTAQTGKWRVSFNGVEEPHKHMP